MGYKQQLEQKKKRDAGLYRYHLDHPLISMRDIGRIYKISHQRVSQIIIAQRAQEVKSGLPT